MPARGCKEVRNRGFRDTGGGSNDSASGFIAVGWAHSNHYCLFLPSMRLAGRSLRRS